MSALVYPHLSIRNGAIIACSLRNWKNLVAIFLGARRNWGLIAGLELVVGSPKVLLPAFILSMSSPSLGGLLGCPALQEGEAVSPGRGPWEGGNCRLPCPLVCLFVSGGLRCVLDSGLWGGRSDAKNGSSNYEGNPKHCSDFCIYFSLLFGVLIWILGARRRCRRVV